MNIFRLIGDSSHVAAVIILFLKICIAKSCSGISGKSQILFTLVYITRYLDLLTVYVSAYNTFLKIFYISVSFATVCLIYFKFRKTYQSDNDTFRAELLVVASLLLALLVNHEFTAIEVLWAFSIYLEAVAILPQLFLTSKTGDAERIIIHYLFALGLYRGCYILNWIYRYHFEGFYDLIAVCAGVVQTVLVFLTWRATRVIEENQPITITNI